MTNKNKQKGKWKMDKAGYSFEKLSESIYVCASEDHRFGTDAFLLTDFTNYKRNDLVCELGTGCGIISLIMSRENAPRQIYAVDIQENAIENKLKEDKDFFNHIDSDMEFEFKGFEYTFKPTIPAPYAALEYNNSLFDAFISKITKSI